jgi:hypothetical protein
MSRLVVFILFIAFSAQLQAAEVKVAVINKYEIDDLLMTRVLAKPENAQAKAAIAATAAKAKEVQQEMGPKLQDPAQRDAAMKALGAVQQEKMETEKQVKLQVQGELIKVIKEATQGRYAVVFDADMIGDAIITKNVEMVDITQDVKEFLLTRP